MFNKLFKNISFVYYVIFVTGLLCVLFMINNIYQIKTDIKSIKSEIETLEQIKAYNIATEEKLQSMKKQQDTLFGIEKTRNYLFKTVEETCARKDVIILAYNGPFYMDKEEITIEYNVFELRGNYFQLMKTLFLLEDALNYSIVSSRLYIANEMRRKSKDYLKLNIYVQDKNN